MNKEIIFPQSLKKGSKIAIKIVVRERINLAFSTPQTYSSVKYSFNPSKKSTKKLIKESHDVFP